jgi:uncharacterized membrane protein
MNRNILNDLDDMTQKGVINEETAEKIQEYYLGKQPQAQQQLVVIFGILGAVLIGLGLILIVAHNWDMMSRSLKTICSVLPMIAGQSLSIYALLKKKESMVWRESSTAFLFFAVGACISLVGQLYNFPGTQASYMICWLLLVSPLMYVMQSSIGSVLFIVGTGYYGLVVNFDFTESVRDNLPDYWYWLLLLIAIPYYFLLSKSSQQGSFAIFHHWLIPISIVLMLGHLTAGKTDNWILNFPLYAGCFALFYQLGQSNFVKTSNGYQFIASVGLITLLVIGTFYGFWKLIEKNSNFSVLNPGFILSALFMFISLIAIGLKKERSAFNDLFNYLHLIYVSIFVLSMFTDAIFTSILCNIFLAITGIATVREGAKNQNIGTLNFGLLILSVIIICRYFDLNISFVIRGFLFLLIGTGFFLANYLLLRKKMQTF